jgi:diacylglycerol kinase family enzyme
MGQEAARERLATAFATYDVAAEILLVRGAELQDAARSVIEKAQRGEADAIAVGGGDGTVGSVAGLAADTGIPIGVLPLGTLNHFAKEIHLPLTLEGAAAAIAAGEVREIDVGEVNGRVFINNSSVGVYPYMVVERERRMRQEKRGKWVAMALALLRILHRFPRRRLRVDAEGLIEACRTPLVFVGNNEYGLGLFALGKRKRLDDGVLWLYIAKDRSPWGLLKLVLRATFGRLDEATDFDVHRVAEAEIASRASRLAVAVDGEVVVLHPPLRYRSRARSLRIIAPPLRQV